MRSSSSPSPSAVERPTVGEPARAGRPAAPARVRWRDDLVTVALAAWLMLGLFLDGWAHNTRPQMETFFTPWHAAFYSGFAATAAWMVWLVWTRRRAGGTWRASVPAGYGLGLAGLAVFVLSGLGDLSWHLAFGIEQDIAALLSPTHLGLFTGGFLISTTALRSAWAGSRSRPACPGSCSAPPSCSARCCSCCAAGGSRSAARSSCSASRAC